jgi:hypothetical protein
MLREYVCWGDYTDTTRDLETVSGMLRESRSARGLVTRLKRRGKAKSAQRRRQSDGPA